jgi:hypothetical protein
VNDGVTRASSEDREVYANHLPGLCARGYISQEQLDEKLGLVLTAETLRQLDELLDGMPKPARPRRPRDYKIPANFIPVCAGFSLFGLTLAIGVSTALGGHHGAFAATVSALCVLWGVWITVIALVTALVKGFAWDDLDSQEQYERRRKDRQGRGRRNGG